MVRHQAVVVLADQVDPADLVVQVPARRKEVQAARVVLPAAATIRIACNVPRCSASAAAAADQPC